MWWRLVVVVVVVMMIVVVVMHRGHVCVVANERGTAAKPEKRHSPLTDWPPLR